MEKKERKNENNRPRISQETLGECLTHSGNIGYI